MSNRTPRRATTINLTETEDKIMETLQAKGITIMDCVRRGMDAYDRELSQKSFDTIK